MRTPQTYSKNSWRRLPRTNGDGEGGNPAEIPPSADLRAQLASLTRCVPGSAHDPSPEGASALSPARTAGDPQKTLPKPRWQRAPSGVRAQPGYSATPGSGDFGSPSLTCYPLHALEKVNHRLKTKIHTSVRSPQMEGDGRSAQDQGRGQGRELAPPLPRKQAGLGLTLLFQVDQATQPLRGSPPQHPHTHTPAPLA